MVDELVKRALEEARIPLLRYIVALGDLLQSQPESRETFECTARKRLQTLSEELGLIRQKYDVELPEREVIAYGGKCLISFNTKAHTWAKNSGDAADVAIATFTRVTLEAILRDTSSSPTLAGLLGLASNYQPGFGSRQVM